jgi:hypothetical protein
MMEVKEVVELYERTVWIWMILEQDEGIHQLDQREDKVNIVVQYLKQRKKEMPISKRMKAAWEMKSLQAELKKIQVDKQTRWDQLEPLQEKEERMILELETEKGILKQVHLKNKEVLKEHITLQVVDTLEEKSV